MEFQSTHKFTLLGPLIAAALLGLAYFLPMHAKLLQAYPKRHQIKFFLASERLTDSHFAWP